MKIESTYMTLFIMSSRKEKVLGSNPAPYTMGSPHPQEFPDNLGIEEKRLIRTEVVENSETAEVLWLLKFGAVTVYGKTHRNAYYEAFYTVNV